MPEILEDEYMDDTGLDEVPLSQPTKITKGRPRAGAGVKASEFRVKLGTNPAGAAKSKKELKGEEKKATKAGAVGTLIQRDGWRPASIESTRGW